MHKAWLLALLAALTLSGCLGGSNPTTTPPPAPQADYLSPAIYAIKAPQEVWIPSSTDGMRLNNAVYLPDVPAGTKVPLFINFSPYWGDSAMQRGDNFAHYMVREYVPRGYAVVLSAVRGTGHSEGCFQIGGDQELKDSYDVIDYFSKQPWSNGAIGAGGKSYDSTTQNGVVAKFPHPALKTLFHVSGITDMYRYNGKDGVTYFNGLLFNTEYGAGQGLDEYGLPQVGTHANNTGYGDEGPDSLQRAVGDAACPELPKENASGAGTAADGMKDAYWQERDWVHFLPKSTWKGSILFVHGLQDWNVKPDNFDPWLQELAAHGNQVKGWLHQWTQDGTGHVYPMRTDWNRTMLRWLDHYLKGVDNGIDRDLGFEVQGSDQVWRRAAQWPPAGTPATATGDLAGGIELAKAVVDPVRVTGTPWLKLTATSMSPDPILYARLVDVAPNGTTTQVNEAARRGLLSDDLTSVQPWLPGTAKAFNLTFYPMDLVLAPGHRLVGYASFPGAGTPGNTGPDGNAGFVITPTQAQVTYGSGTFGYTLTDANARVDPQPTKMKCFTC